MGTTSETASTWWGVGNGAGAGVGAGVGSGVGSGVGPGVGSGVGSCVGAFVQQSSQTSPKAVLDGQQSPPICCAAQAGCALHAA